MLILVTGGAGFIGSHIVDALLQQHHDVRVLDALRTGARTVRPDHLDSAAEVIEADITDSDAVRAALRGVDGVCHQAAMVGLGEDICDIAAYARVNAFGTATLLQQLAATQFRGRLVLASSMVVYGEGAYRCARHGLVTGTPPRDVRALRAGHFEPLCAECGRELMPSAVSEDAPLDPRNVYAATKVHQEHLCFCYSRETAVPVTALRYHNVFGPRMPRDTPYAGVAAIFASALAAGKSPQVHEDGAQLRDFVHVRDVARANVLALTRNEPAPGAFNIASGRPRTVGELARTLSEAAGPDAPSPVITGRFRLGDVRHVFASADRAEAELGFTAQEEFAAGIAEFMQARMGTAA
jgi:dTDP-L-rhamnose 4-epimerase